MNKKLFAGFAGILLLNSPLGLAQQDESETTTIIISASRLAETVDEALSPVTVINQQDIQRSGAQSVGEVLRSVPNVTVANNGGVGKSTSVFLRGSSSDHVLVLIDGVKVSSATSGIAAFSNIPLSQIEKIEVVRGPRSSLYGSEAIGGVIHIFTKKGQSENHSSITVSGGSYNTRSLDASFSGGNELSWFNFGASTFRTRGINACRGSNFAGCFTFEPDLDGYDNKSFSFSVGGKPSDRLSLEAGLINSKGDVEYDGSYSNRSEALTRVGHIKGSFVVNDIWNSSLTLGQAEDNSENFLRTTSRSRFITKRNQVSWLNEFLLSEGRLLAGIDYVNDKVGGTTNYERKKRNDTGVFVVYSGPLSSSADIKLALRRDDNDQFGKETTGDIAYGYQLNNGMKFFVSYGTAFKAPTFNELYYPFFGNSKLVPETSRSIDIGLRRVTENNRWSLNLYRNRISNLIGSGPRFLPVNIGMAEITGLEFETEYDVDVWLLKLAVGIQNPKDIGGGVNNGRQLPRRAKHNYSIDVSREIGQWDFGGTLIGVGKSYDNSANTRLLKNYNLVNLRASRPLSENLNLSIHLNNVFDKQYETAAFYNQPGFNGNVALQYTF